MWTERNVAAFLVRHTFQRGVLAVPNCNWAGAEADVLVVAMNLKLIDIEIKVSRADLKADPGKDKWWHYNWGFRRPGDPPLPRERRHWPSRIWKHYYCAPVECFTPEIIALLPEKSGLLAIKDAENGVPYIEAVRRVKPNPDAKTLTDKQVIDIARLAGLRMWDAFTTVDRMREDVAHERRQMCAASS